MSRKMSYRPAPLGLTSGEEIYRDAQTHDGTARFRRFAVRLGEGELGRPALLTFFASMTAFVRHIAPGIPALAARLSDQLLPLAPYRAHRIAAHVLDASVDEYGLRGTKPHAELLRDFAGYFGFGEDEINAAENAVPAAGELGEKLFGWYRSAPVDYALGVHTASEVTGYEEAQGFFRAFMTPPSYGLSAETPAFAYVATHAVNEEQHSADVVLCLDAYLELLPGAGEAIVRGSRDYLALYERMFAAMEQAMFGAMEPGQPDPRPGRGEASLSSLVVYPDETG